MIKTAFSLFIASLMLFLVAEVLSLLPSQAFSKAFYPIGILSLLASFTLLLSYLALLTVRQIIREFRRYFSGIERRQRRLWFVQGKLDREQRLFFHRRLQTRYFLEARKQRLTRVNDRKHSRSLAKAIDTDLAAIKSLVSSDQLEAWKRQNRTYRKQANIEGLIALQQSIVTHR
ncbi:MULTISPECIES: hypothetical protein [Methylomicrobium]|uniref:Uncharacterized protein n=1 Tax=Methylomicrobium album BG8 TaxID=686340 RepID=H8GK74_METAL|nr:MULTISPECIES: hypothetical protein [Methylomicrobium]EIC29198.1 hypothetical protein Metal_1413 [Methylomicrobium album BG8]